MAVYERSYRRFAGVLTPHWSRCLVLSRYALRDVVTSRSFVLCFGLAWLWALAGSAWIYFQHNVEALAMLAPFLSSEEAVSVFRIEASFFHDFVLRPQSWIALLLALIVGPALISPDLRNNAMPLYLSRPLGRFDYALGKWIALASVLSVITWVPGLVLFGYQTVTAGWGWGLDHWRVAAALFVGSWVLILLLSLFSLAVSAWVKWKPWARTVFFGTLVTLEILAEILAGLYRTWHGRVLSPLDLMQRVWEQLFGLPTRVPAMPVSVAWLGLILLWGACLALLFRRIRAYEVSA